MVKVVTFANFKGGTGKTTNATMLSFSLSKLGYKTLIVDLDPQANATSLLLKTHQNETGNQLSFTKTLMGALVDKNLNSAILEVSENLFLLPSYKDFARYADFLEERIPIHRRGERDKYFATLLDDIKGDYDYILLDVPPTISVITDSALVASDYTIIILQTQERSLVGAQMFIEEMIEISQASNSNLDLLGVLPVILKPRALVDEAIIEKATEMFGEVNMFRTIVPHMERIKRWDMTGITDNPRDVHDKRTHKLYDRLANEFIKRIEAE